MFIRVSDWVFKLGPMVNGQYQYSIITDADDRQLFVLARNVAEFLEMYDAEVKEYLELIGFVEDLRKPVVVPHPNACQYLLLP